MKKNLLTQLGLTAILAISLSACQKTNDSEAPGAPPSTPTEPGEVSTENVLEEKRTAREEALAALESIGLRFEEPISLEQGELHAIKVTFDVDFEKHYLKSEGPKFDIPMQIAVLNNFINVTKSAIEALGISEDPQNESPEDIQKLYQKSVMESQVRLVQHRLKQLEKKMAKKQEKDTQKTKSPSKSGKS